MSAKIMMITVSLYMFTTPLSVADIHSPSLYNMSLLYDFLHVPGKIKKLHLEAINDEDEVVYDVRVEMDKKGCIDSFVANHRYWNSELLLTRDEFFLKGVFDWSPIAFELDKKCNLIARDDVDGSTIYINNSFGYIEEVYFLGKKIAENSFDEYGTLLQMKSYLSEGEKIRSFTYPDIKNRPKDYKMEVFTNDIKTSLANNTCFYTNALIPTRCIKSIYTLNESAPHSEKVYISIAATYWMD